VVLAVNEAPVLQAAQVVLPAASFCEQDGHFVSFQDLVQRQECGPEARGRSGPEWKIALRLATKLGATFAWSGAPSLFAEICAQVPAFQGLSWDTVGTLGRRLPGPGTAPSPEARTGA
jgi:predicted molibdopterin-dependent oxidoreductase YjgC